MIRILHRTIVYRRVHPSGNDGGDTFILGSTLLSEPQLNAPSASIDSITVIPNNFKNHV